jgi:formate hydrogenlyase subunit 5
MTLEYSRPPEALPEVTDWRDEVVDRVRRGERFAGLYGTESATGCELMALLADDAGIASLRTLVVPRRGGQLAYPSLSPDVPAAFWYERALHDLSGVVPEGHPRLDPLLLPLPEGMERPRPGGLAAAAPSTEWEEAVGTSDVTGHGIFSLPLGPVRSGVMESVEFLVETPGEDIPYLNIRPHYKHRGIAKQFEGRDLADGLLVAERVEGISTVAHALAYCHAAEALGGATVPRRAQLIRVMHAELERIANHLDVTMRLCDAAGLAVATARFSWHKETVMRLVSRLCGNRFARGVVTLGGVRRDLAVPVELVTEELATLHRRVTGDLAALQGSASFLDRLRGTGPLAPERAREHGALGPIGRASGFDDDDRRKRAYDAYGDLMTGPEVALEAGDAMARARVRWTELDTSVELVTKALAELGANRAREAVLEVPVSVNDGFSTGWAESAQGEVLYGLEVVQGRIRRCFARSAALHNLVLFHDVFSGDIFTDFPFIEASFGLSYAGVAM